MSLPAGRLLYLSAADLEADTQTWAAIRQLPAATILRCLTNACAKADNALSSRLNPPFIAYGDDFKALVWDIAVYELLSARGMVLDGSDNNIRLRATDAMKTLDKVNNGVSNLEGIQEAVDLNGAGVTNTTPRISTRPRRGW